ncbi:hypothetical protein BC833DRAFT_599653 [Globomyces pollinis-pini]|nr:hypothetical protein BC833DRAFT_599653 [Globomyces pollinis-pini]
MPNSKYTPKISEKIKSMNRERKEARIAKQMEKKSLEENDIDGEITIFSADGLDSTIATASSSCSTETANLISPIKEINEKNRKHWSRLAGITELHVLNESKMGTDLKRIFQKNVPNANLDSGKDFLDSSNIKESRAISSNNSEENLEYEAAQKKINNYKISTIGSGRINQMPSKTIKNFVDSALNKIKGHPSKVKATNNKAEYVKLENQRLPDTSDKPSIIYTNTIPKKKCDTARVIDLVRSRDVVNIDKSIFAANVKDIVTKKSEFESALPISCTDTSNTGCTIGIDFDQIMQNILGDEEFKRAILECDPYVEQIHKESSIVHELSDPISYQCEEMADIMSEPDSFGIPEFGPGDRDAENLESLRFIELDYLFSRHESITMIKQKLCANQIQSRLKKSQSAPQLTSLSFSFHSAIQQECDIDSLIENETQFDIDKTRECFYNDLAKPKLKKSEETEENLSEFIKCLFYRPKLNRRAHAEYFSTEDLLVAPPSFTSNSHCFDGKVYEFESIWDLDPKIANEVELNRHLIKEINFRTRSCTK